MTNQSNNPNSFLEVFYSNTVVVNDWVNFGDDYTGNDLIMRSVISPVFYWFDEIFSQPLNIDIPSNTKKAVVRVFAKEGVIAPKFIAFATLDDGLFSDVNAINNERSIALLDGSELEIFGYDEIRKLQLYNNRQNINAPLDVKLFNENPIPFYLNITLFK